ncbi:hypothetical protein G9A89_008325 [Geosiphon pyriformis]|nr:hypothetical protein G9A89_008325 [Geosiphon pyriformis]
MQSPNSRLNHSNTFVFNWQLRDFQHYHERILNNSPILSETFSTPRQIESSSNADFDPLETSDLWRLGIWPTGTIKNPNHIAAMLIGYQTKYEVDKRIKARFVSYTMELYHVSDRQDPELQFDLIASRSLQKATFFFHGGQSYHHRFLKFAALSDIFTYTDDTRTKPIDLVMRVTFEPQIMKENPSSNSPIAVTAQQTPLPKSSADYLNDQTFCDIEFILDCGSIIKAHRLVIGTASEYFKTLLTGGFRETRLSTIPIKDFSYTAFRAVIDFLYTGILKEDLFLDIIVEIHEKADMMGIEDLQKVVERRMKLLARTIDNWDKVLLFAWQTGNSRLKNVALEYVSDHWEEIRKGASWRNIVASADKELVDEIYAASFFGIK